MRAEGRPAAFIDRDGVINAELGHVHRTDQFHVLPGAVQGLRQLAARGFVLVVVTNQAGIAKGIYSPADLARLNDHMREIFAREGVTFGGIYHCPHHPDGVVQQYSIQCQCRKPAPGMLLSAAHDLGLSLRDSIMVGDMLTDVAAGIAAGVRATVLVESPQTPAADGNQHEDYRCANLALAASWIAANVPMPG